MRRDVLCSLRALDIDQWKGQEEGYPVQIGSQNPVYGILVLFCQSVTDNIIYAKS